MKPDPLGEGILTALGIDLSHRDVVGAVLTWKPGASPELVVTHRVWVDEAAAEYVKAYKVVPNDAEVSA